MNKMNRTYARGYRYQEEDRSERRIQQNRIRRKRELRKNFLILVMTICLIFTGTITISSFRSSAKDETTQASYKYYTSITVANHATLWSIAQQYMDEEHYASVEDYIQEVKKINSLADDQISYGEHLIIPYYTSDFVS